MDYLKCYVRHGDLSIKLKMCCRIRDLSKPSLRGGRAGGEALVNIGQDCISGSQGIDIGCCVLIANM